jgi:thiol:disulfide interchange protein DsbA
VKLRILWSLVFVLIAACGGRPEAVAPTPASSAAAQDQPAARAEPAPTPSAAQSAPASVASAPAAAPDPDAARIELAQADPGTDLISAAGFQSGVHFQRLSPTQPTSSGPDQVEVAEFFMYSCPHCYNFEPYIAQWLEGKPDYVSFVRVPTVWNPLVRMHAQAYYAAEALGKLDEMHTPFFREMHVNGNYLDSEDAIAQFFSRFGVDNKTFKEAYDSFSVHTKLQRADELTRRYRITGTPSVVVNGKYVTTASMTGSYEKLLELVDVLVAAEHAAQN